MIPKQIPLLVSLDANDHLVPENKHITGLTQQRPATNAETDTIAIPLQRYLVSLQSCRDGIDVNQGARGERP